MKKYIEQWVEGIGLVANLAGMDESWSPWLITAALIAGLVWFIRWLQETRQAFGGCRSGRHNRQEEDTTPMDKPDRQVSPEIRKAFLEELKKPVQYRGETIERAGAEMFEALEGIKTRVLKTVRGRKR